MKVIAQAKVNLFLHILGRRENGYHALESLVVFPEFGDELSFEQSDRDIVKFEGANALKIDAGDNSVTRARDYVRRVFGKDDPVRIHVDKRIPVAAGLGGGTADCAATLHALQTFWQVDAFTKIGDVSELGADVPVSYFGKTAMMHGAGERIEHGPKHIGFGMILLTPKDSHVDTAKIFQSYQGPYSAPMKNVPLGFNNLRDLVSFLRETRNDLMQGATDAAPSIPALMRAVQNDPAVVYTQMSGSGATIFGLTPDLNSALSAAARIRSKHPYDFIVASEVKPND